MKHACLGLLCLSLVVGCASETGSTPLRIDGTWVFQIVNSGCPELFALVNGDGEPEPLVFEVFQSGDQITASFIDLGGNNCTLSATYTPDRITGSLTVEAPLGLGTLVASLEGFARDFGGQRQVDGWARVQQDTIADCEDEIIEFCAKIQGVGSIPPPPQLSYPQGTVVCDVDETITTLTPTVGGGPALSFDVDTGAGTGFGPLPSGLSLDSSTGAISGTCNVAQAETCVRIVASNEGGQDTFDICFTVNTPPTGGGLTDAQVLAQCGAVDIVFVIDTSLSMVDDAGALAAALPGVITNLQALAATEGGSISVNSTILGITENGTQALARLNADIAFFNSLLAPTGLQIPAPPANAFDFLTDSVLNTLGGDVPNSPAFPAPTAFADPITDSAQGFEFESWGSGTAIVAERFAWSPTGVRVVAPVSDEGPEEGLSGEMFFVPPAGPTITIPDRGTCDQADADSIGNAVEVAVRNSVIVTPITGFLQDSIAQLLGQPGSFNACAVAEGDRLAAGTGGTRFGVGDPASDMADALFDAILAACRREVERDPGPITLIAFDRDGDLYEIDPATGQATERIDTSFDDPDDNPDQGVLQVGVVSSALFNPQVGELWLGTGGRAARRGSILSLDIFSGAATLVADNSSVNSGGHPGLAIDASGNIFGAEGDTSTLLTVNATSGVASVVGDYDVGGNSGNALTFLGSTLYLALDENLYTVNTATGQATLIDLFNLVGFPAGLTEDEVTIRSMATTATGIIFGIVQERGGSGGARDGEPAYFARIDPATATVTRISTLPTNLDGLAAVPEAFIIEAFLPP